MSPGALHALEPAGELLEHPIAGVVSKRVVHLLEAVEVEQQHRERRPRALRTRKRLVDPVAEQRPVGEAREAVLERLPRQLLLELNALGHIAGVEDDAGYVAVLAQVADVRLEVAPFVEPVLDAEHEPVGSAAAGRHAYRLVVVGMHAFLEASSVQLGRLPAKRPQRPSRSHSDILPRRTPARGRSMS